MPTSDHQPSLKPNALGWPTVVALVISTNGPLTTLISWVPLGISMGNGIGLPGSYLVMGGVYLLFAVGFTAMSRHVTNAGAFYAYVVRGLGRPLGTGAAFTAIFSYIACTLICYAAIGFFMNLAIQAHLHVTIPWWVCALAIVCVVHYFAYRNIEFSGRVLLILMLAEILVILCFDGAATANAITRSRFTLSPFLPSNTFVPGFGPSIVFVVSSFMGFETTAIYSEEVREPRRAIPRATYTAIIVIAAIYAGSTAILIYAYGAPLILARARASPGTLWFDMTDQLLGPTFTEVTGLLLFTSLLAALISFNNATVRYWFALGRDQILWRGLGRIHPQQRSAHVSAMLQTAVMLVSLALCGASGAKPMQALAPVLGVLASVGICIVQLLTSLAVVRYFRSAALRFNESAWQTLMAPIISALALLYLLYQMTIHVDLLVGHPGAGVSLLPYSGLVVLMLGVGFAYYLKRNRPISYERLGILLDQG